MHNSRAVFRLLETLKMAPGAILLDSGDAIGGSNTIFYPHETILTLMSKAGFAAMALGNREFHYLRAVTRSRAASANFPLVCANIEDLSAQTPWRKSIVLNAWGRSIGITGLSPVQFPRESPWTWLTRFVFEDPVLAAARVAAELRGKVDLLLLLSHVGLAEDRRIAAQVEGYDIILGGHSHTVLSEPLRVNSTLIFQTGSHGRYLGKIEIEEEDSRLQVVSYRLIPTKDVL